MDETQFIQTVAPRIGGGNAIQQLNPVQQQALIELLIEKGFISRGELDDKTHGGFARLAKTILAMPPIPTETKKPYAKA